MKQVKVMNKLIAFILSLVFIITTVNPVWAAEISPIFTVESKTASAGDQISIDINVRNNPGILGTTIELNYASELTLIQASNGEALSTLQFSKPGKFVSGCRFVWDGQEISEDTIKDGSIIHLVFDVAEHAEPGKNLAVSVKVLDAYDGNLNPISITTESGDIQIIDFVPGDVNADGKINVTDIVLTRRYIVGGYNVDINELAADVNGDGRITSVDIITLRRYISGGYGIILVPPPTRCIHSMTETPYKAPTCIEEGNISYWTCSKCNDVFSDINGLHRIEMAQTVLACTEHEVVIDPAVKPTIFKEGLTEGSHCSICGLVFVQQKPWKLHEYSVTYDISNGDSYIATLQIENKNPGSVKEGDGFYLQDLTVTGFKFLGWYDGAGNNANKVTEITNASHDIKLYAHWESIGYNVNFKYDTKLAGLIQDNELKDFKYNTNQNTNLPVISLTGYTFVGWSDADGNLCTQINKGTTGDKTYYANWLSNRNQAWGKKNYGEPITYFDDDSLQILFAYEIGDIQNVPIYEIENFGGIISGGVPQTVTKTYSIQTSESLMNSYSKTAEKATTDTASWTLSNGWSDSVSLNREYCEEKGLDYEETVASSKSDTGNWYVTNSKGGSSSTSTVDSTDTYDLKTTTNNTKTYGSTDETTYDNHIGELDTTRAETDSVGGSFGSSVSASLQAGPAASRATLSGEIHAEMNVNTSVESSREEKSTDKTGTDTVKKTGEDTDKGDGSQTGTVSNHTSNTTNTSTWNTESGYSNSSTTSSSETITQGLSERISNKTGYGASYIQSGDSSTSQGLTSSSSSSDSYSSSVSYSKNKSEEVTVQYTTENTMTGYHRWIIAGTAHVFGVVGYDIASKSYFTYTYSIMDDEMHKFEDYSYKTAAFDDNQNSIINFNIPSEIIEYVDTITFETDGLVVDKNGVVTDYDGSDSCVIIPNYASFNNGDGTYSAVKVTGLDSNAFQNNKNITGVLLSDYITEIPDNAFSGCTELWDVFGMDVKYIGENAFAGCEHLNSFIVPDNVTYLGDNAFDSTGYLEVNAANKSVVEAAVNSGAKEITIGIQNISNSLNDTILDIPDTIDIFTLRGYGKEYDNLIINSSAAETKLNRLTLNSTNGDIPMNFSSDKVTLAQVNASNSKVVSAFNKDTELTIYGVINLNNTKDNGKDAIVCKNLTVNKINSNLFTELTVNGDIVTCGTFTDNGLLNQDGEIVSGNVNDFENYLHPFIITFDNNGAPELTEKLYCYRNIPLGELPDTEWEYHTFDGWFTEKENGTELVAGNALSTDKNLTAFAHWTANTFDITFDPNGGTVNPTKMTAFVGKELGTLPVPEKTGYQFNGWKLADKTTVEASTVFTSAISRTFTADWKPIPYTVTFNANGGSVSEGSRSVNYNSTIGTLPTPKRDYYTFVGWFTSADGGSQISESTKLEKASNVTYYAHWNQNPVSGWVTTNQVPAGAQITDRKWNYSLTTYTESTAVSLAGYERYDMYWVESGRGSFAYSREFPSTFDSGNWYYQNWNRDPVGSYSNETSRRDASTRWGGWIYWHWMYDTNYANGVDNRAIYDRYGTGANGFLYKFFGAFDSTTDYTYGGTGYTNNLGKANYINYDRRDWDFCQGALRWFRFNYYWCDYVDYYAVYRYRKTDHNLTATSNPSGQANVSNVVEYVKYRNK